MRALRLAVLLPALLLLGSCSRLFRVEAVFIGGALTFVSGDDDETHPPWCWYDFHVFDDKGEEVWAFDAYEAYRDAQRCGPNFPLTYGREPEGAKVTRRPARLQPGPLYVISGNAAGILEGAFTFSVADGRIFVRNVDPASAQALAAQSRFLESRHPDLGAAGNGAQAPEGQEPAAAPN